MEEVHCCTGVAEYGPWKMLRGLKLLANCTLGTNIYSVLVFKELLNFKQVLLCLSTMKNELISKRNLDD